MKKKAIENIDYLGLPGIREDRNVRFIGVTEIMDVAGEPHFFLEIYRNDEKSMEIPVMRFVFTKKDFGTYTPDESRSMFCSSDNWSGSRMSCAYYTLLPWEGAGDSSSERRAQRNVLYSTDDLKRMESFFPEETVSDKGKWWEYISEAQGRIIRRRKEERIRRERERRKQSLKDRMEHTAELPEKEILNWADRSIFKQKHYLYYRKKGRHADICCSACGGVTYCAWKAGESYESRFEKQIMEPVNKHFGRCPMCGATGTYMPQGKAKSQVFEQAYVWKADRYKETGVVLRYIQLEKEWVLDETVGENGLLEMYGAYEKLSGLEIARVYIHNGRLHTDFHKRDYYTGENFWDDCNLTGLSNITVDEAPLYPGFSDSLKGTELQYSAIELYEAANGKVNARDYMERYMDTPQIEMLVKLRLYGVVKRLLLCNYGIVMNPAAACPDKFLGIRKERLKLLIKREGNTRILSVLQMEKRMEQRWTDGQAEALAEFLPEQDQLRKVLNIMGLQKLLNLISKYAGCGYGTGCSTAMERLRSISRLYFDYISMREQLGYDLENTVYQRPRDLRAAHDRMVAELNEREQNKRLTESDEKYPLIRKNYRKLRKRLLYEDGTYIIRPARSAKEIILEGRILHHCVGGDNYLSGHNEQRSLILMLRFKANPEVPYITVELKGNRIAQWYGAHDKKPDKEKIQRWLDAYVMRLKCGGREAGTKPCGDAMRQMPA